MISATEILDQVSPSSYWYLSQEEYRAMIDSDDYQIAVTRQYLGSIHLHRIERQGELRYDTDHYNAQNRQDISDYKHISNAIHNKYPLIDTFSDDLMVLDTFSIGTSMQVVRCAPWGCDELVVLRFEFFRENAMVEFRDCRSEKARQIVTDILMRDYKGVTIVGDNRLLNIPIQHICFGNKHGKRRGCVFYENTDEMRIEEKIARVKKQLKQYDYVH